jgi:hypothetical protein
VVTPAWAICVSRICRNASGPLATFRAERSVSADSPLAARRKIPLFPEGIFINVTRPIINQFPCHPARCLQQVQVGHPLQFVINKISRTEVSLQQTG